MTARYRTLRVRVPAPPLLLALLASLATPAAGLAQDSEGAETRRSGGAADPPTARAVPLDGTVAVDGRLDDDAWRNAPVMTGFVQAEPEEGIPAEHDTEVRVLFDDDALYVSARMFDPEPSTIADQLVRRDDWGSFDWFSVSVDPNRDRRTGYVFQVSAAGQQSDRYLFDDERRDRNWDAVWSSAVSRDDRGWTAEMRIPLSQIRYEASDDPQTWGVNFARRRLANNELSHYFLISRTRNGRVSQFGELRGIRVAEASRRIEVRPYALASAHTAPSEDGDPFFDGREGGFRTGFDLSYGLTSSFTLDATINPDFGQVEADPAVINLSAFETFFEERRPFFVEDARIFDFGLSGHRNSLFYSRRIGRSPHGDVPSDADYADVPENATILGAAKLTGRTTSGLSVGALAAVTEGETGRAYFADEDLFRDVLVEPRSEYGVFRVQQDFNQGASQVGGIVTGMRRELPDDGSYDWLPATAYSAGVNFEHQWDDREWALWGFLAGSHVRGDSTAIIGIQRSSNHYFQRPDATRLEVDSAATSLTGAEWRLQFERRRGEHWTGAVWAAEVTRGLEINDLGFSQSAERLDGGARVGYREIDPGSWYREFRITAFTYHNFSHEALDDAGSWDSWRRAHLRGSFNLNGRVTFLSNWEGDAGISWSPDSWSRSATRGGPIMKEPGNVRFDVSFNSDRREAVNYGGRLNLRRGAEGSGDQVEVSAELSLRPSSRLEIELEPEWSRETDGAQYVTRSEALPFAPTYGNRYLFADLDRTTVSLETRLNLSLSPTLTFQLFAQPLLSSGDFTGYKQLAEAGTYRFDRFEPGTYGEVAGVATCTGGRICRSGEEQVVDFDGDGLADDAFDDRDFNFRSLIGNAVLRWEYRPGSTLFLVWQRQQSEEVLLGDFRFGRDVDALFGAPAENRFIIKVDYWLGL